jgi:AraC family transcriptional regulator
MWQGIILEKHLAGAEYTRTDFDVHSHLVHSFGSVPATSGWRVDGRNHRVQHTPGGVLIEPKGLHASVQVSRARPDVQWIIELEPAGIEESLNGKPFSPTPQLNLRDPQIDRLVEVLQAEVDSGCPSGSVFGETVGEALLVYLAQRYSSTPPRNDWGIGGLSRLRLKRALEYIEANLDGEVHLADLSKAVGLSPFHFAKLFKESTGASPHQYLLQRRIERVKDLLRTSEMTLSEISLQAGFADQSHLTNVFRRFVGISPGKFRASL